MGMNSPRFLSMASATPFSTEALSATPSSTTKTLARLSFSQISMDPADSAFLPLASRIDAAMVWPLAARVFHSYSTEASAGPGDQYVHNSSSLLERVI